jgi:hypothetical protein
MVLLFFYKNLTNIELIKKINTDFEISDGYIIVEKYDRENNILEISDNNIDNNIVLYGKLVKFNMAIKDIVTKINEIEECKIKNEGSKYILNTIWVNKKFGGCYNAYIIY